MQKTTMQILEKERLVLRPLGECLLYVKNIFCQNLTNCADTFASEIKRKVLVMIAILICSCIVIGLVDVAMAQTQVK